MAVGVKSWSTTAANNATASSAVNWAEGQLAPTLNNSARALMAEVAAWRMQFGGISYGGSANAYTATNNAVGTWSAYAAGDFIGLLANHTNTGAATINVDGLGAKNIVTNDGGSLIAGDLTSGALVLLLYDGTSFQLVGSFGSGSYQPLDATLTALAGVTVAADKLVYATGTDAFATTDFTSFARTLVDDADAATARATLGLTIGTHVQAYDADLTTWAGVTPGTGVATALAVNVGSAGAPVINGGALGTPSSGTLTSATGLPISTGVSGLGTGIATALAINTGSAGAPVLVNGALGTPSSGTLTNATGLPVGGISGLGTGVATFLATPSSANLAAAVTDETGSGALYFTGGALGTPSSATLTNATGLPVSGITASTSAALGVGSIELGHASDTTLSRVSAGRMAVEGSNVLMASDVGTSGAKLPYLNAPNTFSAAQTFTFNGVTGVFNRTATPLYNIELQDNGTARGYLGSDNTFSFAVANTGLTQLFGVARATGNVSVFGTITAGGIAVPTISSSDTLSNKTLSSPTLSGTVAGSPSWSGVQTFPDNSKIGDLLGGNGEARLNDDAAFFSWYNGANTVRSGYLQMTAAGGAVLASEISGANLNITTAGAGALQYNSVAVPTISSTDTLSNKTLSSPTLSGTVAGTPTYSGLQSIGNATGANQGQKITPNGWASFRTGAINTSGDDFYLAYNWRPSTADRDDNGIVSNAIQFSSLGIDFYASGAASGSPTSRMRVSNSGTVTIGGVAVPTISSTDTLTNKTLSSPTLSGTVAGSVTFAGTQTQSPSAGNICFRPLASQGGDVEASGNTFTTTGTRLLEYGIIGFDAGVRNNGDAWLQVRNTGNFATTYGLSLQPNGGPVYVNGVVVPTISSTDTLTNKTLSGVTLSGTAAGSPTFSGSPVFTATQSISFQRSAHDVWQFVQGTPGSTRGIGFNNVTDGAYSIFFSDASNNVGIGTTDPTSRLHVVGGGVQVGAPTGGDKGSGTANFAADIYKNNSAFTNPDYVFEHFYRGEIVEFASNDGASEYAGLMPLDTLREFTRENLHLPQVPKNGGVGIFERGDYLLRAMEENTLYILALHEQIENLNRRLKELEK